MIGDTEKIHNSFLLSKNKLILVCFTVQLYLISTIIFAIYLYMPFQKVSNHTNDRNREENECQYKY